MTTLQDAARKSFEAWKKTGSCFYLSRNNAPGSDLDGYQDAYTQGQWVAWQAALAQQELPQKARPDFMAGYDAGMADAKRMAQQGGAVNTATTRYSYAPMGKHGSLTRWSCSQRWSSTKEAH